MPFHLELLHSKSSVREDILGHCTKGTSYYFYTMGKGMSRIINIDPALQYMTLTDCESIGTQNSFDDFLFVVSRSKPVL